MPKISAATIPIATQNGVALKAAKAAITTITTATSTNHGFTTSYYYKLLFLKTI